MPISARFVKEKFSDFRKDFWSSEVAWAAASVALLLFFCFRAAWAFQVNWQNDDGCYLKYTALISGIDPMGACHSLWYHPPGTALAWWPAGWLAQIGAAITGDRALFWLVPLASLASFAWLGVALAALAAFLKTRVASPRAWAWITVAASPVLFYVIHWPLMAHAAEIGVSSLLMLALARNRVGTALALAVFLTTIRFNDAPAVLLPLGLLWERAKAKERGTKVALAFPRGQIIAIVALAGLVLAFIGWIAFIKGYGGARLQSLLPSLDREGFHYFFFSDREGMLWSSPIWLATLFGGIALSRSLGWVSRFALLWMFLNFLVCVSWKGGGGSFGYRYLTGTYPAALWILLEVIERFPRARRPLAWFGALSAAWMIWLLYLYRLQAPFISEMVFHEGGRSQTLGIPAFFDKALHALVNLRNIFELARANFMQGTPLLAIFFSIWRPEEAKQIELTLHPPALGVLLLAVLLAAGYWVAYFWRRARDEKWRWQGQRPGVIALVALTFLLFFRTRWAFSVPATTEEACYLRTTARILGWNYTSLCPGSEKIYAPLASLAWLPAGGFGSLVAANAQVSRTDAAIPVIALYSFALWGAAVAIVRRWLTASRALPRGDWWALAVVLCSPALYYAVQRGFLPHTTEIALAFLTVGLLRKNRLGWGLVAALALCATRFNDAPVLGLVIARAWDGGKIAKDQKRLAIAGIAGVALVAVTATALIAGDGYATVLAALPNLPSGFLNFWLGLSFGSLWVAPLWTGAWILGAVYFRQLSGFGRAAWAWMTIEMLISIGSGPGGDFGYRSTIGSFAAALAVWEILLERSPWPARLRERARNAFRITVVVNAIFTTYLLIVYKTLAGTGPHAPEIGLTNPNFILTAITAPFAYPEVFGRALIQQFPPATVVLSIPFIAREETAAFALSGMPAFLLVIATLACVVLVFRGFVETRPRKTAKNRAN